MSKITAVKNSVYRSTQLRKGKGISRMYHNSKNMTRLASAVTGVDLLLALQAVHNHWTFNTIIITAMTLVLSKKAVDMFNLKEKIKPFYQPIKDRAEQIYKR